MSGIKIYPPNQLPAEGVSDVQFQIWKEELEVYLETEDKFEKFMTGGRYAEWEPAEMNELSSNRCTYIFEDFDLRVALLIYEVDWALRTRNLITTNDNVFMQ